MRTSDSLLVRAMPKLTIDSAKIKHNIKAIQSFCVLKGLQLVGVVKSCQMIPALVMLFQESGISALGISDIDINSRLGARLGGSPLLITMPKPSQADIVVSSFRASVNSELVTIRALSNAAEKHQTTHEVTLMIETGDLREGILPEDVVRSVRSILEFRSPYLKLTGIGTNLACCSGTLPTEANMSVLNDVALDVERQLGHRFEKVSVGGSIMLDWLESHQLPRQINELRIGEAILLGTIPSINRRHHALFHDAFLFKGVILEVKEKPVPVGRNGPEVVCGGRAVVKSRVRKRAVVDFGRINTVPDDLQCLDSNVLYVGCTSDYSVFDVTECSSPLAPGDEICFIPNYRAMTQSLISPYVTREFI